MGFLNKLLNPLILLRKRPAGGIHGPVTPGDVGVLVMDGDGYGDHCTFVASIPARSTSQRCDRLTYVAPGMRVNGPCWSFVVTARNGAEPEWAIMACDRIDAGAQA